DTAMLAGGAVLDPEQLTAALRRGIGIDARLVDDLTAAGRALARRWSIDAPDRLLAAVRRQLRTVNELRIGCRVAGVRHRLARLTADAAGLAGWLAWESGNAEAAEAYYTLAHSVAREEQDPDADAFVLVARSFRHSALLHPDAA